MDFIGAFLQGNVKHRVIVKLDSRHGDYFPEYCNDFGRPLRSKNSKYGMANSGKVFTDELTKWLTNVAGFKQYQLLMYI